MRETTVAELRKHTKECLDSVVRGEVVRVYRRGVPVADIIPVPASAPSWKGVVPRLRVAGITLADEILRDREEPEG